MSVPNGAVRLVPADLVAHRPALLELNVEYLTWIEQVSEEHFGLRLRDLLGADVRTYTEGLQQLQVYVSKPVIYLP